MIARTSIWTNRDTSLFSIIDDLPYFLLCVRTRDISWDSEIMYACSFCDAGRPIYEQCPKCGDMSAPDVKMFNMGRARVVLEGLLSQAINLWHVKKGDVFEMLIGTCGPPHDYLGMRGGFRMVVKEVVGRSIPNPMASCGDSVDGLYLLVTLECDVEAVGEMADGSKH